MMVFVARVLSWHVAMAGHDHHQALFKIHAANEGISHVSEHDMSADA